MPGMGPMGMPGMPGMPGMNPLNPLNFMPGTRASLVSAHTGQLQA